MTFSVLETTIKFSTVHHMGRELLLIISHSYQKGGRSSTLKLLWLPTIHMLISF